jgi:hypothetical protein
MCISKRMIFNVHEDDMVEGETRGGMEFGVCVEEIHINCEICRIGDNSMHCF